MQCCAPARPPNAALLHCHVDMPLPAPACPCLPHPQVLLKWNVQRGVPVIPKAGSEPHLAENIQGLFTWRLTWDQKVG